MSGYRQLMRETDSAHTHFKNEWKNWQNGRLKKSTKEQGNSEPESVTEARNDFFQKLDILYGKLEPLEKRFRENPNSAFAEICEFLAVDITAFRGGYAKEFFLQKLKQLELSTGEKEKVKEIALKYCETKNVRREFRRWCRLMIKIADFRFVSELEKNLESDNNFARFKSRWMLELIEKHRTDLRKPENK